MTVLIFNGVKVKANHVRSAATDAKFRALQNGLTPNMPPPPFDPRQQELRDALDAKTFREMYYYDCKTDETIPDPLPKSWVVGAELFFFSHRVTDTGKKRSEKKAAEEVDDLVKALLKDTKYLTEHEMQTKLPTPYGYGKVEFDLRTLMPKKHRGKYSYKITVDVLFEAFELFFPSDKGPGRAFLLIPSEAVFKVTRTHKCTEDGKIAMKGHDNLEDSHLMLLGSMSEEAAELRQSWRLDLLSLIELDTELGGNLAKGVMKEVNRVAPPKRR